MTVYIDSYFLLNLLMDYLVLLLAGKVAGEPIRRLRLLLGALVGAAYAVSLLWPGWSVLGHPALRVAAGLLMTLAAYGAAKRFLRVFLLTLAMAALLGGGVYALGFLSGAGAAIDLKLVALGAAGCYCVLSLVGGKLARHGPEELKRVEIALDGKKARLTGLVDSGNTLTDPMTGKPVIVAEGDRLRELLPPEADFRHPAECFPKLARPQAFRLLPYRAVGVDRGLLLAVRADRVTVEGRETDSRLVALSPTAVSDGGGYQALLYSE